MFTFPTFLQDRDSQWTKAMKNTLKTEYLYKRLFFSYFSGSLILYHFNRNKSPMNYEWNISVFIWQIFMIGHCVQASCLVELLTLTRIFLLV